MPRNRILPNFFDSSPSLKLIHRWNRKMAFVFINVYFLFEQTARYSVKNNLLLILILVTLILINTKCSSDNPADYTETPTLSTVTMFDGVLFYDGYATTVSEPVPEGIVRVQNSRYVKKIPDSFINSLNKKLDMEIVVKAACDNYDRIGSVFISLINKNEPYDKTRIISQIEVARFITPFMDKNKSPQEVPYKFSIDNLASLMKDKDYSSKYDFWMEFDIFGVPYAANKQIAGCDGKNYTFYGTVKLTSSEAAIAAKSQKLLPIASYTYLNNYKNTDEIGKTVRSFSVDLTSTVKNAKLYLITSNHGANSGGEEYNRRDHYIYFDNKQISVYKPGGKSCEPFRTYNTQSNGIYGTKARTDSEWSSFSNWCPGDVIPIRTYDLGDLESGRHTFKIEVPDAQFVGKQGEIPLSAYIQGDKN
jgi:hypothetical protein